MKVLDILEFLEKLAPLELAEPWDNCGLLIGDMSNVVTKTLVALDVTEAVVCEAINIGANLIISHHPVIFRAMKNITTQKNIILAIKNDISIISMHTNLDKTFINDILAEKLDLRDIKSLEIGKIGTLKAPMNINDFISYVKEKLNIDSVSFAKATDMAYKIAVLGGSGGSFLGKTQDADTFITGDISHHTFLDAVDMGKNIIDAGHFATENPAMIALREKLLEITDNVFLSKHKDIVSR